MMPTIPGPEGRMPRRHPNCSSCLSLSPTGRIYGAAALGRRRAPPPGGRRNRRGGPKNARNADAGRERLPRRIGRSGWPSLARAGKFVKSAPASCMPVERPCISGLAGVGRRSPVSPGPSSDRTSEKTLARAPTRVSASFPTPSRPGAPPRPRPCHRGSCSFLSPLLLPRNGKIDAFGAVSRSERTSEP